MTRPLVIFGTGPLAQLAHRYFCDTDHAVAAFTIDGEYASASSFCELPVVAFQEVASRYPPDAYDMFVALGYSKVNQLRKEKYFAAKALGYRLTNYISSHALMLNDGHIGDNCFVLENSVVQPFATIGNNVILMGSNRVGHHSTIHDHCFIASHVAVSGGVRIGDCCFIGSNATLRAHINIGANCIVGAGALLLADAEPNGVYLGRATERSKVPSSRINLTAGPKHCVQHCAQALSGNAAAAGYEVGKHDRKPTLP